MISASLDSSYWIEGLLHENGKDSHGHWVPTDIDLEFISIEEDKLPFVYASAFKSTKHSNYFTRDEEHGPLVVSIKFSDRNGMKQYDVLLRLVGGTLYKVISEDFLPPHPSPVQIAENIESRLNIKHLQRVLLFDAPEYIEEYDLHTINYQHKIGVLYQKPGQTTEEEILSNQTTSCHFSEFLSFLGEVVSLKNFKAFSGGLDTKHELTGTHSVYTTFQGREIMFHISSMLPYDETDPQQIQRKRHIGNDIVAIIFQEEGSVYVPGTFKSHFLMVIFIIQAVKDAFNQTLYKVSLIANQDCASFNPLLPHPPVYLSGEEFRIFLFTKLINGEISAMKTPKLFNLDCRTRTQLLEKLIEKFNTKSLQNMKSADKIYNFENRGYSNSLRKKLNTLFKVKKDSASGYSNVYNSSFSGNKRTSLVSDASDLFNLYNKGVDGDNNSLPLDKLSHSEPSTIKYASHMLSCKCSSPEGSKSFIYDSTFSNFRNRAESVKSRSVALAKIDNTPPKCLKPGNICVSLDETSFTTLVLDSLPPDTALQCRSSLGFSDSSFTNSPENQSVFRNTDRPFCGCQNSELKSDDVINQTPILPDTLCSTIVRSKSLVLPQNSKFELMDLNFPEQVTLLNQQLQHLQTLNQNLILEKGQLKSEIIMLKRSKAELILINNELLYKLNQKCVEIDELNIDLQLFAYLQSNSN